MGTDQEKVEKPAEKETEVKNDSIRQDYAFASDVKLKECKYCRVMIPKQARVCPNCKMILKSYTFLKVVAVVLVFGVIVVGVAFGLKPVEPAEEAVAVTETVAQEEVKASASNKEEQVEVPKSVVRNDSVGENAASDKDDADNKTIVEDKSLVEDKPDSGEKDVTEDKSVSGGKDATEDKSNSGEKDAIEDKFGTDEKDGIEEKEAREDQTDAETKDGKGEKSDSEDEDTADLEDKSEEKEKNTTEDSEQEFDGKSVMAPREIDENEAAFRADCVQRKYKSLLRDEAYLETAVLVMEAEVICQVDGGLFDENVYYLCMEEENSNECFYIVRDDRETDETLILKGDIITVYGQLFGTCKLPAYLVETRPTVPAISMLSYDLLEE